MGREHCENIAGRPCMVTLETGRSRKSAEQLIHCCTIFNYNWLINAYRQLSALDICEESISCFYGNHQMEWSMGKTEWK